MHQPPSSADRVGSTDRDAVVALRVEDAAPRPLRGQRGWLAGQLAHGRRRDLRRERPRIVELVDLLARGTAAPVRLQQLDEVDNLHRRGGSRHLAQHAAALPARDAAQLLLEALGRAVLRHERAADRVGDGREDLREEDVAVAVGDVEGREVLELLEARERRRAVGDAEGLRQLEQQRHELRRADEVGAVRVEGGPRGAEVLELLGRDLLEEGAARLVKVLHEDADEERDDHEREHHLEGDEEDQRARRAAARRDGLVVDDGAAGGAAAQRVGPPLVSHHLVHDAVVGLARHAAHEREDRPADRAEVGVAVEVAAVVGRVGREEIVAAVELLVRRR
eukprot:15764-Prymnesium_polylepis.1